MSKKSGSPQASSLSQSTSRSSMRHVKSSPQNRKCVVVGQKMVKSEEIKSVVEIETHARLPLEDSQSDGGENIKMQSLDTLPSQSPPGSLRNSNSSIVGSTYGGFDVNLSSMENDLLNELKSEIETTATQFMTLQSDIAEISALKKKIVEVESEKRLLADELSEKCGIVETMKQRLSVLHEQNSQLAHLTKSSPDSSETTLRMRNALVASLAQLKRLQGTVDELPVLRAEVASMQQENIKLKEQEQDVLQQLSLQLPVGVTLMDYRSLLDENKKLQSSSETEISQVVQAVDVLSNSLEDMKEQLINFEKSLLNSIPLSKQVDRLEKENKELYDEIIRLKLSKSISHSVDTVYLGNECAVLRKANSELQNNIEKLVLQSKQEKDRIVLKLFEIEMSSCKSQKYDIEKRLSDMSSSRVSLVNPHVVTDDDSDIYASLSPQFKTQILKLHQFQLQREQSKHILQLALSEKADVEKKLTDISKLLEEKSIRELEHKSKEYENKLVIAHAKICDLESRLSLYSLTKSSDHAALVSENISLKTQLSSLHQHERHFVELTELKKKLLEEQELHETTIQKYKKYKDQKQKLEAKLKENKCRYQSLASELSNAVQLMKNYQLQCEKFEQESNLMKAERESFHKEIISLKADLETLRAEHAVDSSIDGSSKKIEQEVRSDAESNDSMIVEYSKQIQKLTSEILTLKQKFSQDIEVAQKQIEDKTRELDAMEIRFKEVHEHLVQAEKCLADQQVINTTMSKKLEEETSAYRIKIEMPEKKLQELEQEKVVLSSNVEEVMKHHKSKLNAIEEDHRHHVCALEEKLSRLSSEIDHYKANNSKLLITLSARDASISELTHSLRLKQSEYEKRLCAVGDQLPNPISGQLHDEIEGYKAMIKSLQRQLDEAETREIEHEHLKQTIKMLEVSLCDSSHDNKALIKLLHETVGEIPSYSLAEQSLQDHNLQLEEQISVLSQWNDKQRQEIEELESMLEESSNSYRLLNEEMRTKEYLSEENSQLKRELKEVEIEVNALRRQIRADVQEELKLKLEAKTQLLAVFNQHNTLLQRQVRHVQPYYYAYIHTHIEYHVI